MVLELNIYDDESVAASTIIEVFANIRIRRPFYRICGVEWS